MAFKKLTPEEKAARDAAKVAAKAAKATETKVRKVREPGPKAPKRSEAPAAFAAYEVHRAAKILAKVDKITTGWTSGAGAHFRDADASLAEIVAAFVALPADFKPAGKRGGGRKSTFSVGQRVTLSSDALARVQQLFPDVSSDCVFQIASNAKIDEKMLPVVCLGLDGALAPFFVDRSPRKDLTPFVAPATV